MLPHQALCHDTLHCIVTQDRQMGSSPSNCLLSRFFIFIFHSFFSLFVHLLEDQKKKIYLLLLFFYFPVEPKIFILNFFFPVLHTVKPQKFFSQHTLFFFPSPVASQLLHRCSSLNTTIHTTQIFCELNFNPFPCAKTGILFQNFTKPNLSFKT